jgi:hypothetical protein
MNVERGREVAEARREEGGEIKAVALSRGREEGGTSMNPPLLLETEIFGVTIFVSIPGDTGEKNKNIHKN